MITAGQQVRPQMTIEANLTNRDAVVAPQPYVKWSHEPPRAQDVPGPSRGRSTTRRCRPAGPPSSRSRWMTGAPRPTRTAPGRARARRRRARGAGPGRSRSSRALQAARNPVLVAGPDIDASGGWDAAVALAEKQRLPVWATPATGGGRLGFPEDHPNFLGILPPAIGAARRRPSRTTTSCSSPAPRCSPTTPTSPGPLLPEGATLVAITSDPERRRGRRWATRSSATWRALAALVALVAESDRPAPEPRPAAARAAEARPDQRLAGDGGAAPTPGRRTAIAVVESPSSTLALRNRLRLSRPGSYYFGASGGLGFGISAAVGVQLAQPGRPVVCVLGEGSAQYGITALWTAAAYKVPVTFLVLRNEEYAILKWFAALEQVDGRAGPRPPRRSTSPPSPRATACRVHVDEPRGADRGAGEAIAADDGPRLVAGPGGSGMWFE